MKFFPETIYQAQQKAIKKNPKKLDCIIKKYYRTDIKPWFKNNPTMSSTIFYFDLSTSTSTSKFLDSQTDIQVKESCERVLTKYGLKIGEITRPVLTLTVQVEVASPL